MKIRIRDNSVRFRLTKSEVLQLASKKRMESFTEIAEKTFVYKVLSKTNAAKMSIVFEADGIILTVPDDLLKKWPSNDEIGFYGEQINKSGSLTKLMLEKDFVCLDETEEDQSDNYENPRTVN